MANNKDIKKKDTKKKETKASKPKEKYVTGLKKEIKLVKWPTAKDVIKYTIATVIFVVIFVLFFELLNLLMAFVKGLFN